MSRLDTAGAGRGARPSEWEVRWAVGARLDGRRLRSLTGHPGGAVATADVDGVPVAVTGGSEGLVRVWDLTTGGQIGPHLPGRGPGVRAAATATADGRAVAVCSGWDGTVRVWDLATGDALGEPPGGRSGRSPRPWSTAARSP
ncbi:hypothetical protein [Kitasatospora paranensis]|uniref:WD40 repeat domain-containing protein n=1 Tax=Kitasatospora paranensis TaxID=258053 RepID=UPI0031E8BD8A